MLAAPAVSIIPSPSTQPQHRQQHGHARGGDSSHVVNLRQVLDTPTLREGSLLVDLFLDFISGKHDTLDDLMDTYVYGNVKNDKAVGKAVAASLFKAAGKVNVPVPAVLHHNKAGALR